MHFLSVWWAWGQKKTSGWGSQTRKILMNLCGPREGRWNTLTGTLECQVHRRTYPCLFSGGVKSCTIDNFLPRTTQGYDQGCVAMRTGTLAGLWDLLPCTNTSKYICKQLAEGAVLTAPPPTQTPPKCAQGWTRIGTRNYCVKVDQELLQQDSLRSKAPMPKSSQI